MTDSSTKCAWVIHEKAVQIHVHNKGQGHCLYVPWVPGNVKKPAKHPDQGPVVQSVVSLTSSLRVILLTVLADSIRNILVFFAEEM